MMSPWAHLRAQRSWKYACVCVNVCACKCKLEHSQELFRCEIVKYNSNFHEKTMKKFAYIRAVSRLARTSLFVPG